MVNLNLDKSILDFDKNIKNLKDYIEKIIYEALKLENLDKKNVSVSISAASKEEIRKINNEYRNIDRETDVLSFPIFTKEELKNIKFNEIDIGDIIICLDVVREQAIEYGTGNKREILYMITHGLCHLLGYDHIVEEDKKVMREKEESILSKVI